VYCRKQSRNHFRYRKKERKKERKNKKDFLGWAPIYDVIDSSDVPSSKAPPSLPLEHFAHRSKPNFRAYKWAVFQSIHVALFTALMNFKLNTF
jgi:hypothetical protein